MNLINFIFKVKSFFFLIIFLYTPFHVDAVSFFTTFYSTDVKEFLLPDKFSSAIIHEVAFDRFGKVYLSSPGYLWIYSSGKWHSIQMNGTPEIAAMESGKVYVSSGNQLYRVHIEGHEFVLKNWKTSLKSQDQIKDLLSFEDRLLVITEALLYIQENDTLVFLDTLHGKASFFPLKDALIIQDETGARKLTSGTQISEIPGFNQKITFLLDHPSGYIIIDSLRQDISLFSGDFNFLQAYENHNIKIQDIIQPGEGQYAILYENNDFAILDKEEIIFKHLQNQFQDSSKKLRLLKSPFDQIWVIQGSKLFIIQYPERLEKIKTGLNTEVLDICNFNNQTVLLTQRGLFNLRTKSYFSDPQNIDRIFSMKEVGYILMDQGIELFYEKAGQISIRFAKGKFIGYHKDGFLLFYDNDSIHIYSTQPDEYIGGISVDPFPDPSGYQFIFPGLFFAGESALYVMDMTTHKPKHLEFPSDFHKGAEISMLTTGDGLFLYNQEAIYQFHPNEDRFSKIEPCLPSFLKFEVLKAAGDNYIIGKVSSVAHPGIFFVYDLSKKTTELFNIPSFPAFYARFIVEDLDSSSFLLSFQDQLFKVSKSFKQFSLEYSPQIYSIIAGSDTIHDGFGYEMVKTNIEQKLNSISFANNDFHLKIGNPDFLDDVLAFQYKLNDTGIWSKWMQGNELSILKLKSGDYSLSIRLMNLNGQVSEECIIKFKILPPFLLSRLAMVIFAIPLLFLLFILYRRMILIRHSLPLRDTDTSDILIPETDTEVTPVRYQLDGIPVSDDVKRKARWDKYEMVTVLFSDIQGFTKIAEEMNPERLIDELDQFFFHFDSVVDKYNIEKIKTIGDAYMAAGGIPKKNRSNPVEVVLAALEMQQFMKQLKKTKVDFWDLRIGIHTGPVIAGIVGHKKRSYDIWGDTVNIASRMESSGEAGKVNISGETYILVKDYFLCDYRGKVPVKYKGNLDMYFVKGLRPELSINLECLPNRKFYLKLQILRLVDLEDHVFDILEEGSPKSLYFHTAEYARHLYTYAGLLCKAENLDMDETILVRTAALLFPLGYLENYHNPEAASSVMAIKLLPEFQYSEKQILQISNLILSCKHFPEPSNLLERIMVDIRYEYLGRADFIKMYKLLFLERNEYLENMEARIWKDQLISFLEGFNYYTNGAKRLSEVSFEKQIHRIQEDEWD